MKRKSKKKCIKKKLQKAKDLIMFYEDYILEVNKNKEKYDTKILNIKIDLLEQDIEQMKIDLGYYKSSLEKYKNEKDIKKGLTDWRKSHIMMDSIAGNLNVSKE